MDAKEAVYNPHGKPVDTLPVIYGFNGGGSPGWYSGYIVAEDGSGLGGHVCSHEVSCGAILASSRARGLTAMSRFRTHYPNGYRK